eukprot:TRINITY_DN5915_c0_g2_i1.p1 TRINITY_DN5915_c0_g2~~TRINITY_DN5915_c0_g2_i1.p1  ORF type:complete len:172 (-),score=2.77 TRINITY_DN5915_c0_g2_i1:43-492(-)
MQLLARDGPRDSRIQFELCRKEVYSADDEDFSEESVFVSVELNNFVVKICQHGQPDALVERLFQLALAALERKDTGAEQPLVPPRLCRDQPRHVHYYWDAPARRWRQLEFVFEANSSVASMVFFAAFALHFVHVGETFKVWRTQGFGYL